MGICLALVQVDHENIVVRGVPALDRALQTGDLATLRNLLRGMPFEEPEDLVRHLQDQLARLRQFQAPAVIIESSERRLASLVRPTAEAIAAASLEELRTMLGRWCAEARTLDLDQAADLIHWYCDPGRRQRPDGDWRSRAGGGPPSPFDYALYGAEPYPVDASGQPVIRTGGMPEASWYNPPNVVARVAETVARISPDDWEAVDAEIESTPEELRPHPALLEDRLQYARDGFEMLAEFYRDAAERGFGVSVEYY